MESTCLRKRLADGEVLLGLNSNYPSAALIETIGSMWDFIWIDGQHGQFSYDSALTAVRTTDLVGTDSLLRVSGQEHSLLGLYADMLPSALMVPVVDTPEQAKAVVDATMFPPLGNRSYGGRRPIDHHGRDYYLGDGPVLILQIETPQAVENAAAIANIEGIDGLFLGTDDLKIRSGLSPNASTLETEAIAQAMAKVGRAAKDAGKVAGCPADTPDLVKHLVELGYQIIAAGSDKGFLQEACREKIEQIREVIPAQ